MAGTAGLGLARLGGVWQGKEITARRGAVAAGRGQARPGGARPRLGEARYFEARPGLAGHVERSGVAGLGRRGKEITAWRGTARLGKAGLGGARRGSAGRGNEITARPGAVRLGSARRGEEWLGHGLARQGTARRGNPWTGYGQARAMAGLKARLRHVAARCGEARQGISDSD